MNCPLFILGLRAREGRSPKRPLRALCEAVLRSSFQVGPVRWLAQGVVACQEAWAVKHGERSVGVPVDPHVYLHVVASVAVRRELEHPPLKVHAVVLPHGPNVLLAQDLVEADASEADEGRALLQRRVHDSAL
jgi:hypothetical protein